MIDMTYLVCWSLLANTIETWFCLEAHKNGLVYAQPEIINSDQRSQFTSEDWVDYLNEYGIKISMTGKGEGSTRPITGFFYYFLKG